MNILRMRPPYTALFTAVILAAALNPAVSEAEEHTVEMKNWLFRPAEIAIRAGDRITWVNRDDTMHNIYFEDKLPGVPTEEETQRIKVGKSFSVKIDKPGVYRYNCKNHLEYGMTGKVTVEGK